MAERARAEKWTHEEFLVACLQREVSARESHGGEGRIRAARFPARKSLEDFDFDHARGLNRDLIAHLGTLYLVAAKENVVFLGPPGTGKTHLATGLAIRACQAGHRVLFATASQWVDRLADAHHAGRLQDELVRLGRYPLLSPPQPGRSECARRWPGRPSWPPWSVPTPSTHALGLAAIAGRFGDGDLASILDHLATAGAPDGLVVADENHSAQPGTARWAAFGLHRHRATRRRPNGRPPVFTVGTRQTGSHTRSSDSPPTGCRTVTSPPNCSSPHGPLATTSSRRTRSLASLAAWTWPA